MAILAGGTLLQNAATTGNGSVADLEGQSAWGVAYVEWGTGASIGTIVIEHNGNAAAYTGTWATLATVVFSGTAPYTAAVQWDGAVKYIRARFSVNSDAATTVRLWANY